ncbi:hypothetical protein [Micromonospora sp. WMMD1155]|uniref:hypothetical protein n=1 Tax=Micromonospora sp. WMMD1155 TaxID=3016094 RepID=UPI002499DF32|nr:hypothetical protein [Micromonospora sp. WMMD1155]WFE52987.1 hypothetical protein O7617_22900 [Micromonospora sp. WMMD1155]
MITTADDFTADADHWGFRKSARSVGPDEWLHGLPQERAVESLHLSTCTDAIAAVAGDGGIILNFRPNGRAASLLAMPDGLDSDADVDGLTLSAVDPNTRSLAVHIVGGFGRFVDTTDTSWVPSRDPNSPASTATVTAWLPDMPNPQWAD